ncbi:MAG: hypothetical protein ACYSWU_14005 [Planctomycetota bacterium]|jgi:hypothetical protein
MRSLAVSLLGRIGPLACALAADGTLYHIDGHGDWAPGSGTDLMTLDPSTGAELTSVSLTTVPSDRSNPVNRWPRGWASWLCSTVFA